MAKINVVFALAVVFGGVVVAMFGVMVIFRFLVRFSI